MSFAYFRDVLPSGLRVVTVEAPHLHTALIAAYVRAGSRHEAGPTNGVSHFLEHMLFRGSERYPDSVRMNAAVEEVGGNLNGVTTRDHGYYYTPLHPAHLEVGFKILGDMLTRPLLSQMEVERQIILEEMLDEVDDKGRDIDLDNLSKMALFSGHPLALKIAGTPPTVKALSRSELIAHFERHYVAQNMVVAATGRVQRSQVLEMALQSFGELRQGQVSQEAPPPASSDGPRLFFTPNHEAQTEVRLCFRTVPEQHPDHPALTLLRRVLDDGLSSRLPFNVVEQRGLAYSVYAGLETFHDAGIFELGGASAPEKAAAMVEAIGATLTAVAERGPTDEELLRAQRRHRMFLDFSQDSPGELAGWFGGTEVFRPPESLDALAQASEAQTPRSLQEAARRYFRSDHLIAVAVGPKRGRGELEQALGRAVVP